MRHWNRGRKTVRNFLLAPLLVLLVYASQGFPPYTVEGMCRRVQHDYLLGELEPLHVRKEWFHYAANKYMHRTMVLARSGETYTIFRYEDGLLGSQRDWSDLSPVFGEGAISTAWRGNIYAAGPFEKAASATAVIRAEKLPDSGGEALVREFTLEGERAADQVFVFPYDMGHSESYWEALEGVPYERVDPMLLGLREIAELWYRKPDSGSGASSGVYTLIDAELPCTVTLYGESGEVLEVFDLSVTTRGLRSWW